MAVKSYYINPECFGVGLEGTDNNNCSVRALANATAKPIHECYAVLAKYGRQRFKGATADIYFQAYKEAGLTWVGFFGTSKEAKRRAIYGAVAAGHAKMPRYAGMTIGTFLKVYSTGTFIVCIAGHLFCVKNGAIIDSHANLSSSRVLSLWKV